MTSAVLNGLSPDAFAGVTPRHRTQPLLPGDPRRLGQYEILGRLGEGGMGTVYLGSSPAGRAVAVKVVKAALAGDPAHARRFRSEVARAQQVPPYCTAEVLDADLEHDPPFLAIEYVDGPSLGDVVERDGPLSPANLYALAVGTAAALTAIHGASVIHRDLKPSNVLLAPGSPKVIDFGLAQPVDAGNFTGEKNVVGTVPYMAPERFGPSATRIATQAVDIFGWGAVIAFAGTGRIPFGEGGSALAIAQAILNDPPDLGTLAGPLRDLVAAALSKDPRDRPTARELLDRLTATPSTVESPYLGLASYQEDDADRFFGREELTASLLKRFAARLSGSGLLAVLGPSGSGKSSVLRAGLLASLERGDLVTGAAAATVTVDGVKDWPRVALTPGAHPLRELASAVAALARVPGGALHEEISRDPKTFAVHVLQALRAARIPRGSVRPRLVLVVDQFEEVFTLCADEAERRAFIAALRAAAGSGADDQAAIVVLGIRADFYSRCAAYPELVPILEENVTVGPMGPEQLRRAIEEPARQAGLTLEPGLVEVLLLDVGAGNPGVLPLLSHALYATWQQRTDSTLGLEGYRATGGVGGAVAASAETVYQQLGDEERAALRRLLPRMVEIREQAEDTRRRVDLADLITDDPGPDATVARVLNRLAQARLVTVGADTAEVAHEALIRAWPRLRSWLDEDRADLIVRQRLSEAARSWAREDRDPGGLYAGVRLETARPLAAHRTGPPLSTLEKEFLETSIRAASRRKRVRRAVTAIATILVLVAGAAGAVAFTQYGAAREERELTASRQVAAQASALRATDPATALQLALTAYKISPTPQAREALFGAYTQPFPTNIPAHKDLIHNLRFTPDGRTLVSSSRDGSIALWDVADARHPKALSRIKTPARTIALSADGKTLVGAAHESLSVWDISDPRNPALQATVPSAEADPYSVAFAPDGRWVATGSGTEIRLWDLSDPRKPTIATSWKPDNDIVFSVAFSPDGRSLASANAIGADKVPWVRIWNVTDRRKPTLRGVPLETPTAVVVAWSPDGTRLASSGPLGPRVWDVTNPDKPGAFKDLSMAGGGLANSLSWRADGKVLAAADDQAGVSVWRFDQGEIRFGSGTGLVGPGEHDQVVFRPDGEALASGGADGTIALWSPTARPVPGRMPNTGSVVPGSPFSADHKYLVTDVTEYDRSYEQMGPDIGATVWDVSAGTPRQVVQLPVEWRAAAFMPGGRPFLVSRDKARTKLRFWDVADPANPVGGEILPARSLSDNGAQVTITEDGQLLAIASEGSTEIQLWDLRDPLRPVRVGTVTAPSPVDYVWFAGGRELTVWGKTDITLWNVSDPARPGRSGTLDGAVEGGSVNNDVTSKVYITRGRQGDVFFAQLWVRTAPDKVEKAGIVRSEGRELFASPDNRMLGVISQDTLELWDISDPRRPVIRGALTVEKGVGLLTARPDSKMLVGYSSSGVDRRLLLWRVDGDPTLVAAVPSRADRLQSSAAAFTDDSRILAAETSASGYQIFGPPVGVQLWDLEPKRVYERMCGGWQNVVDKAEWKRYFPTIEYTTPC
ncbi:hypothetical protein Val02_00620 [Virgisporangium aliadipatigenens]|uniref:Protein kinase domain-containing protein n=1 Tax=Virgisporangium aliadipatigenens TaxID=741659 RepID=A0A8J3YFR8_9ACTN|nr:protein kinase [Virgisporangium aliadipatigenens]GIJ43176.1 hypothetical protein Val02_00620 [Virgisporangium aliadipatigenens]